MLEQILLILISAIGSLMLLLISQVMASIKELKQEIKVLQSLENRITIIETIIFKKHGEN